jgi:hypothetical protein
MAITGVLDYQRRSLPLGEIRIGESEAIPGKKGRKPVRRDTFRFTTPVKETADAIAAKFGGTPVPWDRRKGYWVVDTDVAVIEVWVPPRGKAVDAFMELWDENRRRVRQCDGITDLLSGRPCMCPQPEDRTDPAQIAAAAAERKRLATQGKACKPVTRINVQIPGLPGVTGVWVLRTNSANAAVETADTGDVLERARNMDVYLPALVLIHWRPGQDGHPYPVLTLRLRPSAEQIAELPPGMDGMLAMLNGGSGPLALTGGAPAAAAQDGPERAEGSSPEPEQGTDDPAVGRQQIAEQIATGIPLAQSRKDLAKLIERAKAAQVLDHKVWFAAEEGDAETEETLRDLFDTRWWELPGPPRPATRKRPAQAQPAAPVSESLFDDNDPALAGRR